ncbi:MAG: c-type cytochrome [Saprospiraceae bacterium]
MKIRLSILILLLCEIIGSCKFDQNSTAADADPSTWPKIALPAGADTTSEYWKGIDLEPKAPVLPLPVDKEKEKFLLQPGFAMEAVLTEPKIQQPAAINFDGNGRMYVLELRSYMLTADSKGTLEPVSCISRWEDKDNDGVYETGGVFVDSLVFPRFVLPYGPNSVLTMESNADNVYKFTDTNNDGKADKKEFFTDNFGRAGNVEHQQAFLYWGMDNWLYSTVNPFRVRETDHGVIRESTASNHAQWGITHDDDGKLWFQGGSNGLPSYFQFPVHYGDYVVRDTNFATGFDVPWGAPMGTADMQGGMGIVRQPDGSLNRVTGASGNDIFRGDKLPDNLKGQYFYGEPVARIVRQVNAVVKDGITTLHNVFQDQKSEFIRSTDPLFRPVDMATAPDGTMYIVDMYHGIIQEGEWTPVGSYLRAKIEQYQLDKVINLGRIWRLEYNGIKRDQVQPHMYDQSSAELLQYLDHPNGWWRDMAQQILVQRKDKSVTDGLVGIVKSDKKMEAKFHALWVLEGLGTLDAGMVKELLKDANPRMRKMALWLSESLYKAGDKSFDRLYISMMNDNDTEVKMRALMTGRLLKIPGTVEVAKNLLKKDTSNLGIKLVARQVINPQIVTAFFGRANPNFSPEQKVLVEKGSKIFGSLCATCHGPLGSGMPAGPGKLLAPSFINSSRIQSHPDYTIKTLLHGMMGNIEGESYTGIMMAPMKSNTDEWIASVVSFVRSNFENESSPVTPEYVASLRKTTSMQSKMYSFDSLWASIPKPLQPDNNWKITASNTGEIRKGSTASPKGGFSFEGWTTGEAQKVGMWYMVELPEAKKITELQFKSQPIFRGFRQDGPPPVQTCPSEFDLEVSMDGKIWTKVLSKANGTKGFTDVRFDPVLVKFLKMTLTKSEEIIHGERRGQPVDFVPAWTMREFKLLAL